VTGDAEDRHKHALVASVRLGLLGPPTSPDGVRRGGLDA
jgi:hypothetical protein